MGTKIDTPSGDVKRDLAAQKQVELWRPQPQIRAVRAMPDLGPRILRFVLATPGVKGDGHSLDCSPEAWDLSRAKERCPMLWSHGYGDRKTPPLPQIGEWVSIEFERADGEWVMVGDGKFSAAWEGKGGLDIPGILYSMYLPEDQGGDGFRGAASIGWTPLEAVPNEFGGYHMTRNRLTEASIVVVGEDEGALQVLQRAIGTGRIPSQYAPLFEGDSFVRAAHGKAYVLDFHDREPETRSTPPAQPAAATSTEPEVCILDTDDDAVTFETVAGGVGIVLQHRGGKPDAKAAQRQLQLCRQALSEKKAPVLEAQWRATPVVSGRPMTLTNDGGSKIDRDQVVRAVTEALEKGTSVVLPSGWNLRSAAFTRSDRSDALDVLTAQLWAFFHGAEDNVRRICWQADTVFWEDETGESYGGMISTEDRIEREIKVARSMLSASLEVLDAIESTLEPEPEITGTAMTASFQRVGKKYAAATVKKLKDMAEHHTAAAAIAAAMLEEAEAQAKAESETSSGSSDLVRLAAELDAAVSTPPTPLNDEPPATRSDPFADLTRSLSGEATAPTSSSLADLAESLRGAA